MYRSVSIESSNEATGNYLAIDVGERFLRNAAFQICDHNIVFDLQRSHLHVCEPRPDSRDLSRSDLARSSNKPVPNFRLHRTVWLLHGEHSVGVNLPAFKQVSYLFSLYKGSAQLLLQSIPAYHGAAKTFSRTNCSPEPLRAYSAYGIFAIVLWRCARHSERGSGILAFQVVSYP